MQLILLTVVYAGALSALLLPLIISWRIAAHFGLRTWPEAMPARKRFWPLCIGSILLGLALLISS
jgi:hypothetical protein